MPCWNLNASKHSALCVSEFLLRECITLNSCLVPEASQPPEALPTVPRCLVPGLRAGSKQEIEQEFGKPEDVRNVDAKQTEARVRSSVTNGAGVAQANTVLGTDKDRCRLRKDHSCQVTVESQLSLRPPTISEFRESTEKGPF